MSDLTISFIRAIASLSVTLGLIVLAGWVWKNYGQSWATFTPKSRPAPRLTVIETRRLNATITLHLVQEGDTEHLIATSSGHSTVVSSKPVVRPSTKSVKTKS